MLNYNIIGISEKIIITNIMCGYVNCTYDNYYYFRRSFNNKTHL